jgi:hypothetical protein
VNAIIIMMIKLKNDMLVRARRTHGKKKDTKIREETA